VLAFQDEDSSVSAYFQPYKPFVPAKTEPEAEQDSGQQVVIILPYSSLYFL
jgi:hypothetical protein